MSKITPYLGELLNRELIELDNAAIPDSIRDARIVITGAGGSLGSTLARTLLDCGIRGLALVENHENSLFHLRHAMAERIRDSGVPTRFVLADVRDVRKMRRVMADFRPDILFHLAAYKHVPLAEEFPEEFVLMNILGTWNLSRLARENNVRKLVYPSTDKAVRSPSVYGVTKRTIELMLQTLATEEETTQFTVVRLVNVLGAHGGVIETFVRQICADQPITITHPDMTRYWITISEALYLLIQAAGSKASGNVLLLDMGEPIKVDEVAHKLWRLLRPGEGELQPAYVGIRPGERLSEELAEPAERIVATNTPGILEIKRTGGRSYALSDFVTHLDMLEELARAGLADELRRHLFTFVGA
ncbi:MAG: polysaccharide biosynthesis protein [Chloroflexi bacterium]|nr:polysaccharide biosynthesis protein [Chloroflexota bacterium]